MSSENCLHSSIFSHPAAPSPTSRQNQLIRQMWRPCSRWAHHRAPIYKEARTVMNLSQFALSLVLLLMLGAGRLAIAQDKTDIIKASDAAFDKGEYTKALPLYLSALEKGAAGIHVLARIAACYARAGARDEAFSYLDKAIETGQELERLESIAGNDDFAGLQRDARWTATLRKYLAAWGPSLHYIRYAAENLFDNLKMVNI